MLMCSDCGERKAECSVLLAKCDRAQHLCDKCACKVLVTGYVRRGESCDTCGRVATHSIANAMRPDSEELRVLACPVCVEFHLEMGLAGPKDIRRLSDDQVL